MTVNTNSEKFELTAGEVAQQLNATVYGDDKVVLSNIRPIESATHSDLTFIKSLSRSSDIYKKALNTNAGAVIIPEFCKEIQNTQIVFSNPLAAIVQLAGFFQKKHGVEPGIHPSAIIDESAFVDPSASIGAYSVIGKNVSIGANTVLHPHVVVYAGSIIGRDCVIHAGVNIRENVEIYDDCIIQNGTVVGSDGFGYIPDPKVGNKRIPHIGKVVLSSGVDIGANSTVDRGTFGETHIHTQTKLDNLVQIGHNATIGERSLLCAQVGVSGSVKIGKNVILAGQSGVSDHISVGDNSRIGAKAGAVTHLEGNNDYAGFPAIEASIWRRSTVLFSKFSELSKRISKLEKNSKPK